MYGLKFFQKVYLIWFCYERLAIACPCRHKRKHYKAYDLSHMQKYAAEFFYLHDTNASIMILKKMFYDSMFFTLFTSLTISRKSVSLYCMY